MMWAALEHAPGLVVEGSLTQQVACPTGDAEGSSAIILPAAMGIEAAFRELGARHSKGEGWLRAAFSPLDRYERRGGGSGRAAPRPRCRYKAWNEAAIANSRANPKGTSRACDKCHAEVARYHAGHGEKTRREETNVQATKEEICSLAHR